MRTRRRPRGAWARPIVYGPRAFKSKITEIENDTFRVFQKSKEITAYYVQWQIGGKEGGYLAAHETRTGNNSTVNLLPALAANATQNDIALRNVEGQGVGNPRGKSYSLLSMLTRSEG